MTANIGTTGEMYTSTIRSRQRIHPITCIDNTIKNWLSCVWPYYERSNTAGTNNGTHQNNFLQRRYNYVVVIISVTSVYGATTYRAHAYDYHTPQGNTLQTLTDFR